MTATCWADPLTRMERRELRLKLARACKRSHMASRSADAETMTALTLTSVEMTHLYRDVTERAKVATS